MNGTWSASRSARPRLQNEGLHQLPRPFCWLPALLFPMPRAFLVAAAASSSWSCYFSFGCPIMLSSGSPPCWLSQWQPVISGAAAILNLLEVKIVFRFLDCRGTLEKLSKAPQSVDSSNICVQCTLLPDPKQIQWGLHGGKPPSIRSMLSRSLVIRIVWSFSSVVWNPTFL